MLLVTLALGAGFSDFLPVFTCYPLVTFWSDIMLKACSRCGKIHGFGECGVPVPAYRKKPTDITRFRSSRTWERKRAKILERDLHLCRLCLHNGYVNNKQLEVHHIISLRSNFELRLEDSNLITLCRDCHELVHKDKDVVNLLISLALIPPMV